MTEKDHKLKRSGTKRNISRGTALGPKARDRFRQARRDATLTTAELARNAKVSEKVIKNIESASSSRSHFDDATLTKIARALGKSTDELVYGYADTAKSKSTRFDVLEQLSHELDEGLIPLIRDLRRPGLASSAHQDILRERLRRSGVTLEDYLALLNDRDIGAPLISSLPPTDVEVDVEDRLAKLVFHFNKDRIDVPSPKLLWDCGCSKSESKESTKKCPIHEHPGGDNLAARFNGGHVLIRFHEAQYRWRSHASLWPPSIDSFYMYMDLDRAGVLTRPVASVLDLGCGTGFLGIGVALRNPHVVHVTLADWLLTPLLYSRTNWFLNRGERTHVDVRVRLGLFTDWRQPTERPFDLLVCNPPYLPLLDGFDELGLETTVAGTDLLEHVIRNGCSMAREVYVQFSDLADVKAKQAAREVGVKLVPIADPHNVPFRLSLVWKHPDYLAVLQKECGLRHRPKERHHYWHRITTYRIER